MSVSYMIYDTHSLRRIPHLGTLTVNHIGEDQSDDGLKGEGGLQEVYPMVHNGCSGTLMWHIQART